MHLIRKAIVTVAAVLAILMGLLFLAVGLASIPFFLCVMLVLLVITAPLHFLLRLVGRQGFVIKNPNNSWSYKVNSAGFRRSTLATKKEWRTVVASIIFFAGLIFASTTETTAIQVILIILALSGFAAIWRDILR
jgi:hypothetical protein